MSIRFTGLGFKTYLLLVDVVPLKDLDVDADVWIGIAIGIGFVLVLHLKKHQICQIYIYKVWCIKQKLHQYEIDLLCTNSAVATPPKKNP